MDKRILTVQDISCVGQCSLTVALPILSAFGIETGVLPTAVLSNHTGGFTGWTFADLTEEIPKINAEWGRQNINFDAIYTGYMGSAKQIDYVLEIFRDRKISGGVIIVDPAMADNGKLYAGFDNAFVKEMAKLVAAADIILPNITEACFLAGTEYAEGCQTEEYVEKIIGGLRAIGAKKIVLTGVTFSPDKLGVAVNEGGKTEYRFENFVNRRSHGTGDIFASVFTGAFLQGDTIADAAQFAARVVIESIKKTMDDDAHWYGVKFEKALPMILSRNK
ncbi:MAG: pyridoxamine kinase [Clostridia bacterium]|nr:pyridoxamine kinase [Clostridia bacterium]